MLKTVETEIAICESNLHDEIEKRKKYKVKEYLYEKYKINIFFRILEAKIFKSLVSIFQYFLSLN